MMAMEVIYIETSDPFNKSNDRFQSVQRSLNFEYIIPPIGTGESRYRPVFVLCDIFIHFRPIRFIWLSQTKLFRNFLYILLTERPEPIPYRDLIWFRRYFVVQNPHTHESTDRLSYTPYSNYHPRPIIQELTWLNGEYLLKLEFQIWP